jgi:hypothetical protein
MEPMRGDELLISAKRLTRSSDAHEGPASASHPVIHKSSLLRIIFHYLSTFASDERELALSRTRLNASTRPKGSVVCRHCGEAPPLRQHRHPPSAARKSYVIRPQALGRCGAMAEFVQIKEAVADHIALGHRQRRRCPTTSHAYE